MTETPQNPPAENTPEETPQAKWTDQDLDKFKGTARLDGKNIGKDDERQRWLDQLGVKDEDEAKNLIESQRQYQQEHQTELQAAQTQLAALQEQLSDARSEVETAQVQLDQARAHAELRVALIEAGANPKRVQKILNDDEMPEVEVTEGQVNADHVKAFVAQAKDEWAEFFGGQRQGIPASPQPGGSTEIDPVEAYLSKTYGDRKEN
jgi:hypothetical protein